MLHKLKIGIVFILLLAFLSSAYAWTDYGTDNSTISGIRELTDTYSESNFWLIEKSLNGTDFNITLANASIISKQDFNGRQFKLTIPAYNEENLTISLCDIPNYEINESYEQYDNEWLYSFNGINWTNATPVFFYRYYAEKEQYWEHIPMINRRCNRGDPKTYDCPCGISECRNGGFDCCKERTAYKESYNIWKPEYKSIYLKKELYGNVNNLTLKADGKTECFIDGSFTNSTNLTGYFNKTRSNHAVECNITRISTDSSFDVENGLTLPRWTEKECIDIYANATGEVMVSENISNYNISGWNNAHIMISGFGSFQNPQWQNLTIEEPEEVVQEATPEPEEEPKKERSSGRTRRRPPVYSQPPEPKVNLTVSKVEPAPLENLSVTKNSTAPLTLIIEEKVEEVTKPKSKSGYVILAGLMLPLIFNGASIYRKIKRSSKGMKVEIPD